MLDEMQLCCTDGFYFCVMEKDIHPITGFKVLVERDNLNNIDRSVKPLASRGIKEFLWDKDNLALVWFSAFRTL